MSINYDAIGNPLSYYNGSSYTFSWTGRQLTGATKSGITYSFTYNDEGIRTSKTKGNVTTTYYLDGSRIVAEETNGNVTVYLYDSEGLPIGMQYRAASYANDVWDAYWYERNLQGDVVAVYNSAGTKLVSYTYDAWGNCTATSTTNTVVANNPFRYRGYYYDVDLGLYYLNTRYYDANTGRFISPDKYISTGQGILGNNMYAYCGNNPVMHVDYTGTSFKSFWNSIVKGVKKVRKWLNEYALNSDGTYSLYDNDRFRNLNAWHEQILSGSASKPSLDLKEGDLNIGNISVDAYTGGWEWENADLSLIDVGHAEIGAGINNGELFVGAFASAWSPSFSVTFFDIKIEIGAEVGSIGGSVNVGSGKFSAKAAYGWGLSFSIEY